MKTKLFSKLLTTFTAIAAVLSVSAVPAKADELTDNPYFEDFLKFSTQEKQNFDNENTKDKIVGELSNPGEWVDLNNLTLNNDSDVKVYLLGEGGAKKNALSAIIDGQEVSLWDDVQVDYNDPGNFLSWNSPLNDGDNYQGNSVSLAGLLGQEKLSKGTSLEFLLTGRNDITGSNISYSTVTDNNSDGLQHAFGYLFDDRYMVVGFEDKYGGLWASSTGQDDYSELSDRDMNDVLFVFDMGEGIKKTPEPATTFGLLSVGAAGLVLLRRRQNDSPKS